jgi:hypothetical protein
MTDLLIEENVLDANGVAIVNNYNFVSVSVAGGTVRNNRLTSAFSLQSGTGGTLIGALLENNVYSDGTPLRDSASTSPAALFVLPSPGVEFVRGILNVDMKLSVPANTIFTVPTGKTFVLTGAFMIARTVTALSAQGQWVINYDGVANLSSVTNTGTAILTGQVQHAAGLNSPTTPCPAGQPVQVQTVAATATTFKADFYVRGYYLG